MAGLAGSDAAEGAWAVAAEEAAGWGKGMAARAAALVEAAAAPAATEAQKSGTPASSAAVQVTDHS